MTIANDNWPWRTLPLGARVRDPGSHPSQSEGHDQAIDQIPLTV